MSKSASIHHERTVLCGRNIDGFPMAGCFGPVTLTWMRPPWSAVWFLIAVTPDAEAT